MTMTTATTTATTAAPETTATTMSPSTIWITGGHGMLGSRLATDARAAGHDVLVSGREVDIANAVDVAVFIAGRHSRMPPVAAPKLLKTRAELAAAPIDHRDAFVLSLLDDKTSVQGVVDIAAMPDGEVVAILERLAKLGIVRMP